MEVDPPQMPQQMLQLEQRAPVQQQQQQQHLPQQAQQEPEQEPLQQMLAQQVQQLLGSTEPQQLQQQQQPLQLQQHVPTQLQPMQQPLQQPMQQPMLQPMQQQQQQQVLLQAAGPQLQRQQQQQEVPPQAFGLQSPPTRGPLPFMQRPGRGLPLRSPIQQPGPYGPPQQPGPSGPPRAADPPFGFRFPPGVPGYPAGIPGDLAYTSMNFRQRTPDKPDLEDFSDDDQPHDDETKQPAAAEACQPEPEVEATASGSLSLSTRIEYSSIPKNHLQNVYGIVTVQAADEAVQETRTERSRQPLDLICVLDVSGSMSGAKIGTLKEAMRFVIGECLPKDRLSIVSFNHAAQRQLKLRRMDADGKDDATQAALRLMAGGGTAIAPAVALALEVAEHRRQRNPVSAIFLLTDGQDGSAVASYQPLLERARRLGISLYAFGFGRDHDARLLSALAEQAQTPFTYVEDVNSIGNAFAGALGGLASVSAQRLEVTLDCKATLTAVHTPFNVTRDGNKAKVEIPDMLVGSRRDILVEMSVPAAFAADEAVLLEATAQYWDLKAESKACVTAVHMRARVAADDAQPEQEPDEEVVVQRNRVQVAQCLQAAAAHGDAGRFEEAKDLLATHKKRIRSENAQMQSPINEGLATELEQAQNNMRSQAAWLSGGMAATMDACQMHYQQRSSAGPLQPMPSMGGMAIFQMQMQQPAMRGAYSTPMQCAWYDREGRK